MNFFGVNGASVNGTALAVVLSGALAVAGATASASAYISRPGAATQGVTASVTANGVRMLMGQATITPTSTCTAEWSIAKDAGATIRITAIARASYSDANAVVTSTITAKATHIKGGEAVAVPTSNATAKADRKAGAEAIAVLRYYTDISTNIKRAGQSTTEREGFAIGSTTAYVTATGDKTMLSYATGGASSAATAVATHNHGGQSVVSILCTVTALGASDTAYSTTYSDARATPTHTQLVEEAKATTLSTAAAGVGTARRPAQAWMLMTAVASADGRIATLAEAAGSGTSAGSAAGRLALQGQAFGASSNGGWCAATATRPAAAVCAPAVFAEIAATRICMGASTYLVKFSPAVDAISNPSVPAPFDRTMRVPADDRVMRVPYENREMRVV